MESTRIKIRKWNVIEINCFPFRKIYVEFAK